MTASTSETRTRALPSVPAMISVFCLRFAGAVVGARTAAIGFVDLEQM